MPSSEKYFETKVFVSRLSKTKIWEIEHSQRAQRKKQKFVTRNKTFVLNAKICFD